jgi:hypothetical protein
MVLVAQHDARRIQSQVALKRKTRVVNIRWEVEYKGGFEALARSHFGIQATKWGAIYWRERVHGLTGYLINPAGSVNQHSLPAKFPLRPATRPVRDANVNEIEGSTHNPRRHPIPSSNREAHFVEAAVLSGRHDVLRRSHGHESSHSKIDDPNHDDACEESPGNRPTPHEKRNNRDHNGHSSFKDQKKQKQIEEGHCFLRDISATDE